MEVNLNNGRKLSFKLLFDKIVVIVFSLSLSFFSTFLKAENLEEVYELALKNDPLLKAAEASYRAGKENKVQGRSGLLPNLSVSGSTNWNEYRVMDQIIDQYNSNNYSGRLSQPLFRMDKWFQFKRGKALSESAGAEFAYQQQETMIRVASAYFNVLNSIDSLNAARAEEKLPEQTAIDKTYNYNGKVIIIGAGASGLAAGKILEQNNIDYTIIEATDRYGGRLKKDTILADFPIDIGAEWLHSAPITLNKLKGKKGDNIDEELIPYHLDRTASWDGKELKIDPHWQNNFMYYFLSESKFKNTTWYVKTRYCRKYSNGCVGN